MSRSFRNNSTRRKSDITPDPDAPRNKRALLVLPGLGFNRAGGRAIAGAARRMTARGVDLYLRESLHRDGVVASARSITDFIQNHKLADYEELYIMLFIAGWLVMNPRLGKVDLPNLRGLILDRSPTQERAPRVAARRLGPITRLLFGRMVSDLAALSYQSPTREARIGLLIETRATPFARFFRRSILSYGPLNYDPLTLEKGHADFAYVPLHHIEMYTRFPEIEDAVLTFMETGRFPVNAERRPPETPPL